MIWDEFYREKCIDMFTSSKEVIDIGGSLRLGKGKGNVSSDKNEWLRPYVEKVDYKILDPVPDYNPDIVGDIHDLPFEDDSKEAILCLAVLEHVKNPIKAMEELHRVLKPGGKFVCLEFSKVNDYFLQKIYDAYSFKVIPKIGKLILKDRTSYQYLIKSIRKFPTQDEFKKMIEKAGFETVSYKNLSFGSAAIHVGIKK